MRRDQLEHAIRAACQILQAPEVIVVGSQSILGTYRYDQLPRAATLSMEIDILPMGDEPDQVELLSDRDRVQSVLLDSALVDARVIAERLLSIPARHRQAGTNALQ